MLLTATQLSRHNFVTDKGLYAEDSCFAVRHAEDGRGEDVRIGAGEDVDVFVGVNVKASFLRRKG